MADLRTLYRDTLLDHGKSPRNHAPLAHATHAAAVDNPICGDHVRVELLIAKQSVGAARFTITGCLVATASASMMTEAIAGRSLVQVERLCADVEAVCAGADAPDERAIGLLSALAAVRAYPARRRCAALPWMALRRALHPDPV